MKRALLAAAIALAAVTSVRAQDAVQAVEAPLAALDGDWVTSGCGGEDRSASAAGQSLALSFTDATGLADVEILVRIHWRHHDAPPCAISLNDVALGVLDQPRLVFPCIMGRYIPTTHLFKIPAGAYIANGVNRLVILKSGDEGSVGVCDDLDAGYALRLEIRPLQVETRAAEYQVIEAGLADLGGDWVLGQLGGSDDLTANVPGQALRLAFDDATGFADVEIQLEIHWRHHKGRTCAVSLNGVSLGDLDQPRETLEVRQDVFYPTVHFLRVPSGAYRPGAGNEFVLTFMDVDGGSAGICEPPGMGVAMRLTIPEGRASAVAPPPPSTNPIAPQGIVLVDLATGTVLLPGVILDSPNLQIMAILNDADGDYSALEIVVRRIGSTMTAPYIQSLPVASGGQVIVILPMLGPGTWQIEVRAIDQRGTTSEWVAVETAIEVTESAAGRAVYRGVEPVNFVLPRDFGSSARSSDHASGGSCSAGAAPGAPVLLLVLGALALAGSRRKP